MLGIEIKNVSKRFGNTRVLNDVSLSIGDNEFIALLGPSGCGKTTLLRCIAGLETPDEGEIIVNGVTVFSAVQKIVVPPGQRGLGMVFQSYALWPHMKTADNVGFGLELQKIPKSERDARVAQVLAEVGLEGLDDRYPSELSGGQQQRVALARLLATQPAVFLMDEPLSNLDARLRMDMRGELKRLHREAGASTIYVTHDQGEAMTMSDRVVVMKDGRIQQVAPPGELYRQPQNLFVAEFIGMPRMNLLDASATPKSGGASISVDGFALDIRGDISEREVIVAARPEDIRILSEPTPDSVEFEVYVLLPAGSEVIIQLKRGNAIIYAREDHRARFEVGQKVPVILDADSINVFSKASGQLISGKSLSA